MLKNFWDKLSQKLCSNKINQNERIFLLGFSVIKCSWSQFPVLSIIKTSNAHTQNIFLARIMNANAVETQSLP